MTSSRILRFSGDLGSGPFSGLAASSISEGVPQHGFDPIAALVSYEVIAYSKDCRVLCGPFLGCPCKTSHLRTDHASTASQTSQDLFNAGPKFMGLWVHDSLQDRSYRKFVGVTDTCTESASFVQRRAMCIVRTGTGDAKNYLTSHFGPFRIEQPDRRS